MPLLGPATTDADLVARALAGSQDAYRDLVLRYQRPLYSFVLRMARDPALAEDLSQEVFLKVFRALRSFDPQRKFSSWLFKIAHNTVIDQLRRASLDTEPLEAGGEDHLSRLDTVADPHAETPEQASGRKDLAFALERVVGELRTEYREIVLLRFQEGLAYEEIAEISGLPLGTVKTHLHRARKEMVARLRGLGWGPTAR